MDDCAFWFTDENFGLNCTTSTNPFCLLKEIILLLLKSSIFMHE